jgi:hypothetical protein
MDFSIALQALKTGHKVRRPTWAGYCLALMNGSLLKLLESIQDTDSVSDKLRRSLEQDPENEVLRINADALVKRRNDLARRLDYGSDSSEPSTFWFPAQGDLLAEDWEVVE